MKQKKPKKGTFSTILLFVVFFVGLSILLYPTFSDWWNSFHQSHAIATYADTVAKMDNTAYEKMLKAARKYNKKLAKSGDLWRMTSAQEQEYNEVLKLSDDGIMSYIQIKKIQVSLPIYHGTEDTVLQVAIGHIPGTSLPVGGKSTHCVLSGHRGLPSAKLFTSIDRLEEGDKFIITTLEEKLTYEVDQIRIVLPNQIQDLQIEEGKDLCTLVTCTPYGVNTHRLLVRGHRVANEEEDPRVQADALQVDKLMVAPLIAALILLVLLIFMLIRTRKTPEQRRRIREQKRGEKLERKNRKRKPANKKSTPK